MSIFPLYTAQQSRELDRYAIDQLGMDGFGLMVAAGRATFDALLQRWPEVQTLHVFCGTGNNGGDGWVIASLAHSRGLQVEVCLVGDLDSIDGDAARARDQALSIGVSWQPLESVSLPQSGLVVDALLGTGLAGKPREAAQRAIDMINTSALPVVAVDCPSGVSTDSGTVFSVAVRAALTVTFIGRKRGLYTAQAPDYVGELLFAGLDVPPQAYEAIPARAELLQLEPLLATLTPLSAAAHKGGFGHALLVGGDHGYGGAVTLAAEAAGRCGAGLVSVATRHEHVAALIGRRPEVMACGIDSGPELEPLLQRPSALAIGPGLGQGAWAEQLLQRVLDTDLPRVLDADALNLLARGLFGARKPLHKTVITPHPGEAARLLQCSVAEVQADRFAAAQALHELWGAVVLLKGAGTVVYDGARFSVCADGNPGMASGGMGDVLTGVICAFLAQGLTPQRAATLGACLHARAGDSAAAQGQRGLLAADLMAPMRQLLQ